MKPITIRYPLSWISSVTLLLSGCSSVLTSRMPSGSVTMAQAYQAAIDGSSSGSLSSFRQEHRKKIYVRHDKQASDTDLHAHGFSLLPNPMIHMYVYPHLAGSDGALAPIPGYTTDFPLYTHIHYALPNQ